MPGLYPTAVPVPRTWSAGMRVKAPYLRADVAQSLQLLASPPAFAAHAASSQSVPNSTDELIYLDTEDYDNLGGHVTTTNKAIYYGMFPGWYLWQGTCGVDYTGGSGVIKTGIGFSSAGGAVTTWWGQRAPLSGSSGQRQQNPAAKLIQFTNVGTQGGSSNDYVTMVCNQLSGGSQNTFVGADMWPQLQGWWIAASTGTAGLAVPANDPWPSAALTPPYASTTLTAQANSGTASIQVASAAGLVAGGTIGLDVGTSIAETATVAGTYTVGSLTVPLTANLAHTHTSGANVNVPVSAAFLNRNVRDALRFLLYPPIMEAYYAAGTQTLATQASAPAVGTTVNVDTTRVDNYSAFNTSANVWTVPAGCGGVYWCYFQAHQAANSSTKAVAAGLTVTSANYNGGTQVTLWGGSQSAYNSGDMGNCALIRRKLRLNAGDTVSGAAFQHDSGSASTTLDFSGGTGVSESRFITVWAGA